MSGNKQKGRKWSQLLIDPWVFYKRGESFALAVEKLLLVTSTVPGPRKGGGGENEPWDSEDGPSEPGKHDVSGRKRTSQGEVKTTPSNSLGRE